MKPQIEKPSDPVMMFLTPELLIKFNSPDDEVADRADADWEEAITAYRTHLDRLRDHMSAAAQKLADLCLHDAELLAVDQQAEPDFAWPLKGLPLGPGFAIVSLRQDNEIVSLFYVLWDRIRKHEPNTTWPFSRSKTHWLYDEVDVAPIQGGSFLHRVLLSDGTVLEIPFVSVLIHSIPLSSSRQSDVSTPIAR
jgi:hypothetical protein